MPPSMSRSTTSSIPNPSSALDNGIEDRLNVSGRAANDAERLGGRRLMLQGFAQFCVAFLDFLEQANVFLWR